MTQIVKYLNKTLNILFYTSIAAILIGAGYFLCRIFIVDQFVIPSDSMYPTLQVGDRVWVNKLVAGARIYNDIDSASSSTLQSWRTRGLRRIERNDILIFNYPINDNKIAFKINYVYAKRCVALPGDSISAVNGYYKNSNYDGILGYERSQDYLNSIPDSLLDEGVKYTLPYSYEKYPWNIRNFGPVYVPRKGDVITLDKEAVLFYSKILEFETEKKITINSSGEVFADEQPIDYHIFTHNYYFTVGDNVMNSGDSRYWGFVPEEYIVGIVGFIPYSIDKYTNEFRWDRFLQFVN